MPARATAPARPATASERAAAGRAARGRVPRSQHGAWAPAADRADPAAILREQDASRLPELVPIRYGRMLASPFAFYRGSAAIMAADLAATPGSGLPVQLCGDAHLANFGLFLGPDRRLLFDVDDFDETHIGPWEWDVKRLAASLEVAARDRALKPRARRRVVLAGAGGYRRAMRDFAAMGHLAAWYARLDVDVLLRDGDGRLDAAQLDRVRRTARRASLRDSTRALAKLTTRVDGRLRFRSDPPLLVRFDEVAGGDLAALDDAEALVGKLLRGYRRALAPEVRGLLAQYRPVDLARKVVGVGSVGARCWVALLEGRDERDPLVLQAKEAGPSILERHLGPSRYANAGERVVRGQRAMQAAGDVLLGWQRVTGVDGQRRDFYLRQLWDGKGSAAVETMDAGRLELYAELCGWTLARAHARSGDRIAIASYLGGGEAFDRAMAAFADAYADQVERDYRAVEGAVDAGAVAASAG